VFALVSDPVEITRPAPKRKDAPALEQMAAEDQTQTLLESLLRKVEQYNPAFDRDPLVRAFAVASSQHQHQLRASGEAYLNHPVGPLTSAPT